MPTIPALRRLRQEDPDIKTRTSLGYIVRPCLKRERKKKKKESHFVCVCLYRVSCFLPEASLEPPSSYLYLYVARMIGMHIHTWLIG
jgi:hypothetical protein